jgi:hypothetical protein
MIEKLIKKLKGSQEYKWESSYSIKDLVSITWVRFWQLIRGLLLKPFLKKSAGLIFIGTNVKVRHGYNMSIGKNLILGVLL